MKLIDIIEVFIAGDWGEETYSKETPCAVTCVRGADIIPISEYDFSAIPVRYINQQAYAKKCLQVGDIIIEKSGGSPTQSTGRVSLVSQELLDHAGAVICSNFCTAFRVKKGWNPLYVYYYLQFIYNLGAFFNFEGKTSGIKNLQLDAAFAAIPIEDISESIQNNIVAILQGLERKIAINRQINQNLEAMAKQLYDYWFVQFDFPNEEGKPYKSSGGTMVWNEKLKRFIPKGWESTTLGNECHMYQPKTLGLSELDEAAKYKVYGANGVIGKYHTYNHENSEIAMACRGNSCGTVNRTAPFSWITGNAMVIKMIDGSIHNEYIKQALQYANVDGAISGSGQPQLTRENLNSIKLCKPTRELIIRFSEQVSNIVEMYLQNESNIEELTKQRDELLPLLMNGQVSVNSDLSLD